MNYRNNLIKFPKFFCFSKFEIIFVFFLIIFWISKKIWKNKLDQSYVFEASGDSFTQKILVLSYLKFYFKKLLTLLEIYLSMVVYYMN